MNSFISIGTILFLIILIIIDRTSGTGRRG